MNCIKFHTAISLGHGCDPRMPGIFRCCQAKRKACIYNLIHESHAMSIMNHSMVLLSVVMLDFESKTTCESVGGGSQISIVFPPMLALAKSPFSPRKATRCEVFDSDADCSYVYIQDCYSSFLH